MDGSIVGLRRLIEGDIQVLSMLRNLIFEADENGPSKWLGSFVCLWMVCEEY